MEIFYKNIRQYKIVDKNKDKIANLKDILIDLRNGRVVAFVTMDHLCFLPTDILGCHQNEIQISNKFFLKAVNDLEQINQCGIIIGKKVFTKSHEFLGRVRDFAVDTNTNYLELIKVVKKFFFFLPIKKHEIYLKNIIEINEKEVIVDDILIQEPLRQVDLATA